MSLRKICYFSWILNYFFQNKQNFKTLILAILCLIWCLLTLKNNISSRNQEPNFQLPKVEMPKVEMPKMPEIPKVDVKAKLTSLNESIRTTHIPTPQELKDGYMNSNFQKSFTQTLQVRTRQEDVDVQKAREFMTQRKTPAELSQMNHPLDIPLPKFKLPSLKNQSAVSPEDQEQEAGGSKSGDSKGKQFYGTFPRSAWGQQNIITRLVKNFLNIFYGFLLTTMPGFDT